MSSSSGLQSGYWEASKNGKKHFCTVSGGYACVGTHISSKEGFSVTDSGNCEIEKFNATSSVREFVRKNLGEKVLEEVSSKIAALVEQRNKRTAAPAKES